MTLSAATAMAADVTGTWTGEAKGPDGSSFQLTFTFKQDGATLTGTVQLPQNDPIAISNGKVDGDKFTFDDSFNGITIHHDCTVDRRLDQDVDEDRFGRFPGHGADADAGEGYAGGAGCASDSGCADRACNSCGAKAAVGMGSATSAGEDASTTAGLETGATQLSCQIRY